MAGKSPAKRPRGRPKKHTEPRHPLVLRLDRSLHRELKRYATDCERPLHDILVEVIVAWWATQRRGGSQGPS